jgi:MFS transporter, DHA2 family, multidrug resistance protein
MPPGNPPPKTFAHLDGLPVPRRYWSIAAILLAIIMSVLDSTIVNVALPSIARDFRVEAAARCGW